MTLKSVFTLRSAQRSVKKRPRSPYCVIVIVAIFVLPALVPVRANAQGMKLLTPTTGWFAQSSRLYWTTDSGSHWSNITPVPPGVVRGGVSIRSVFFRSTQKGWVVVSHPQTVVLLTPKALRTRKTLYDIAHTVDGGQRWSFLPLTYPKLSEKAEAGLVGTDDIYFLDSLHGWLVMAFDGNSHPGRLLVTDDGGRNWTWGHGVGFSGSISFTSLQDGWFLGGPYNQLFATHDGCKTWQEVRFTPPPEVGAATNATFQGLPVFSSREDGFVAVHYSGRGNTRSKFAVYSTHDGGKTWKLVKLLPETRVSWQGVQFPFTITDSTLVVPTGSKNVAVARLHLTGQVESVVAASRTGAQALSFADPSDGWALGPQGKLLATADGGTTWKDITPWRTLKPASTRPLHPIKHPKKQIEVTHPGASSLLSPMAPSQGGGTADTTTRVSSPPADTLRNHQTPQSLWTTRLFATCLTR